MVMRKIVLYNILLAILCLFTISCTTDEMVETPPTKAEGGDDKLSLSLTINTPPAILPKTTTKSQTPQESEINEIRVLVFKNDTYTYWVEGTITNSTASTTTFDVSLQTTSSPVDLFLLANANQAIANADIRIGDSKDTVKSKIQLAFTSAGMYSRFPMFGEHRLSSLDASGSNQISGIKMLRSIARADVLVSDDVANFEMVSVQVYRATNTIQVIPNAITDASVSTPSIPDEATGTIITSEISVTGNQSESQLYLPEANAPAEDDRTTSATCIIVGGKYNNNPVSYYRIDFNLGIDGHPFGQVLRNHKYIFNIKRVGMPGESSPEEAANKPSTGITAEVVNWDESTTDMWYEGEQYFGVSSRKAFLPTWAKTYKHTDQITVSTNIGNYTIQWADKNGNPLQGSTPSTSSIANANYAISIIDDIIYIEALSDNLQSDDREDYFVIRAGKWSIRISITQYGDFRHINDLVRVLSFTEVGSLGNGYASDGIGGASGNAMRQLLNYQFSPAGIYALGGYHFTELSKVSSTTSISFTTISNFDVIYFPYNQQPSAMLSTNIVSWLNLKRNRVLIVSADNATSNINLLSAINDNLSWSYGGSISSYNFVVPTAANDVFVQSGPFGSVSPTSVFGSVDATWGKAVVNDTNVIPLLTTSNGSMVLGVNPTKRVVYIGDVNMFQNLTGNYLTGDGSVSNDQDRLLANLWAWITDVVLSGK